MPVGGKKNTKKRGNNALKSWVAFVKKVAKEEKLSYRDAMMRAKARKDKGEKWMKGGDVAPMESPTVLGSASVGGKRRRRTMKKRKSRKSRGRK
jgi:hypothetical protein